MAADSKSDLPSITMIGSLPSGCIALTSSLFCRFGLDTDPKEMPASKSVQRQRAEREVPDSYNVTSIIIPPVIFCRFRTLAGHWRDFRNVSPFPQCRPLRPAVNPRSCGIRQDQFWTGSAKACPLNRPQASKDNPSTPKAKATVRRPTIPERYKGA